MKIKVLELFGGISAPHKALINLGLDVETVDYVEFDPKVVEIRNAMYNTEFEAKSVVGYRCYEEVDLLIGGSPCQDFSNAGHNKGGDEGSKTRSSLMWEQLRIIEETKPKITIWENVKNVLGTKHKHNFEEYQQRLEQIGYNNFYQVLNAVDFGIPQGRERVFLISVRKDVNIDFDFNKLITKEPKPLNEFINFNLPYDYKYNRSYMKYKNYYTLENNKGNYNTQCWRFYHKESFCVGTIGCNTSYKIGNWENETLFARKMTPKETFLLMGFGESDYEKVSGFKSATLYHVAGNSIVVDVLEAIFKELFKEKE